MMMLFLIIYLAGLLPAFWAVLFWDAKIDDGEEFDLDTGCLIAFVVLLWPVVLAAFAALAILFWPRLFAKS